MFSGYEQVLLIGGAKEIGASSERVAAVGAAAGAISTFLHDSCMVPAETIKQRLQLGYYRDGLEAAQAMLATGGGSFFRSLPTTLAMNVPYCSLMMMSNESLKKLLVPAGEELSMGVTILAGAISGAVAAAFTTPLDVIKTRLQVQSLSAPEGVGALPGEAFVVRYTSSWAVVRAIAADSGFAGFWRGLGPRVAMYGPSCAVSWAAYEGFKKLILRLRGDHADALSMAM